MKSKLVILCLLVISIHLHSQYWVYCLSTPTDTTNFNWYGDISKHGREGKWLAINETTQLKIYSIYNKGLLDGPWLIKYRSGKVKEQGNYIKGYREGVWVKYYENGDTMNYAVYKRNVIDGPYRQYHLGNLKACNGYFVNGRKQGKWQEYFSYSRTEGPFTTTTYNYVNDTIDGVVLKEEKEKTTIYTYRMGTILSISESAKSNVSGKIVAVNEMVLGEPEVAVQQNHVRYNFPYLSVETPAEFPGGDEKLKSYLSDTVDFPLSGYYAKIGVRVTIVFTVEKDGSVSNAYAQDATQNTTEEINEAIRLVTAMPTWKPALYCQEPVPCLMVKNVTLMPR